MLQLLRVALVLPPLHVLSITPQPLNLTVGVLQLPLQLQHPLACLLGPALQGVRQQGFLMQQYREALRLDPPKP